MDLEQLVSTMPFAAGAGVTIDGAAPDRVVGSMAWAPERCTAGGVLHGGALMTLADTIGAVCAFLNLPPGASTSTIQSGTNLLRAVRSGRAVATATPLHVGRSTIAVQVEIRDDEDRLVSVTTQTQAVLLPR